jgi:hypothetical protein
VDELIRDPDHHQPTIGILWVARRSDAVVDLTLKTMGAPLAVSTYDAGALPAEVRELLPSEEDLAHTFAEILAEEH